MSVFVLDESAIKYMLESFPRKLLPNEWSAFDDMCKNGQIVSSKETKNALENTLQEPDSFIWLKAQGLFMSLSQKGAEKLGELRDNGLFDFIENSPELLRKMPVSLPFNISITSLQEDNVFVINKDNIDRDKIKNLCENAKVQFMMVDDFLSILQGV